MICPNCHVDMGKMVGKYQYRECGLDNVWITDLDLYKCPDCQMKMPILPDPEKINKVITIHLVREGRRLDADSILFLRKAMQLTAEELALSIGVTRVEVSRWENDHTGIDAMNDFKVRMTAIEKLLPVDMERMLRSELAVMFHKTYNHATAVGDRDISVPYVPIECVMHAKQVAALSHM